MKIKNILAGLLALAVTTTTAKAEGGLIEFGLKGGITTQNVNFSGAGKLDGTHKLSTQSRAGFHLGALARINLPLIHFQPEILFSQTSYRLGVARIANTSGDPIGSVDTHPHRSKVRLKSVDVPVLVGMRVMWLHVQAGPMFTVMSETTLKDKGYIRNVSIARPSVSYLLGIGLDIKRFTFDVRFNGNFKKYTQSILYDYSESNPTGKDFRSRHKYWTFSVGYLF